MAPLFAALGRYSPPVTVATITGLTTLLFIVVGFLAWINLKLSGRNVKI
jgi:hypothetical protein